MTRVETVDPPDRAHQRTWHPRTFHLLIAEIDHISDGDLRFLHGLPLHHHREVDIDTDSLRRTTRQVEPVPGVLHPNTRPASSNNQPYTCTTDLPYGTGLGHHANPTSTVCVTTEDRSHHIAHTSPATPATP